MNFINESEQMNRKQQKNCYYPDFINEEITEHKIAVQVNIVEKIICGLTRRRRIPKILLTIISSYCFKSPLQFNNKVCLICYDKKISPGEYYLLSKQNKFFEMNILNIWHKKQVKTYPKSTMLLAQHFIEFIMTTNFDINEHNQNEPDKWTLISSNPHTFWRMINCLKGYWRCGKINSNIVNSFQALIGQNIILLKVGMLKYIYIGNNSSLRLTQRVRRSQSISFNFTNINCFINSQEELVGKSDKMINRNIQQIILGSGDKIKFDDIFIVRDYFHN